MSHSFNPSHKAILNFTLIALATTLVAIMVAVPLYNHYHKSADLFTIPKPTNGLTKQRPIKQL